MSIQKYPLITTKQFIQEAVFAYWAQLTGVERVPVCAVSPPGIGKSSIISNEFPEAMASFINGCNKRIKIANDLIKEIDNDSPYYESFSKNEFYINAYMCPSQEGAQAMGLPVPMRIPASEGKDAQAYTVLAPSRLSRPSTKAPFVITFLDEFDKAGSDMKMALSEFINSGRIGDTILPKTNFCIMAMNRKEDRSGTTAMPMHIQNRIIEYHVKIDPIALVEYLIKNTELSQKAIGFVQYNPGIFVDKVPESAEPYCTPRSFVKGLTSLQISDNSKAKYSNNMRRAKLAGSIGLGAAADYFAYEKYESKCTPFNKIIADPENAKIPENLTVQWAQQTSLWVNVNNDNVNEVFTYMLRMPKQFWASLLEHRLLKLTSLFKSTKYMNWATDKSNLLFLTRISTYK